MKFRLRVGSFVRFLFSWQFIKVFLYAMICVIIGQAVVVKIWHPHLVWPWDALVQGAILTLAFWLALAWNHYLAYKNKKRLPGLGANDGRQAP